MYETIDNFPKKQRAKHDNISSKIQAEAKKKLEEEQLPKSFENLDKYLEKGSGYFVGDKVRVINLRMSVYQSIQTRDADPGRSIST